jgi:F-type H+-transporting ATPase subunit alpha
VGNSVSRVGGNAQIKAMKQVAGTLRIELAQYRELAAFAQFGSDLDKATQAQLARGERLTEILKQNQYQPLDVIRQIIVIFAGTQGFTDDLQVSRIREFEQELYQFMETAKPSLLQKIASERVLSDTLRADLKSALKEFKEKFQAGTSPAN